MSSKRRRVSFDVDEQHHDRIVNLAERANTPVENILGMLIESSSIINNEADLLAYFIKKLPYSLRIWVLDFVSVKATRFYVDLARRNNNNNGNNVRPEKFLYSYETREYVDKKEFIQLLYGYFVQDRERKIYLVFGYLVFRSNMYMEFVPQKNVRQLYFLNEKLSLENLKKIPLTLRSLCFSDLKIRIEDITRIVKKLRQLRKFAIQNVEGLNNTELMDVLASKCTIVRVMDCNLRNQCVEILVQSPTIKNINLNTNVQVTTMGILKIREIKNIVHFRMNNTNLDDQAIELFLENPQIHELQLTKTKVTQKGFLKLLRSPSNIRSLEWMDNEMIRDLDFSIRKDLGGNLKNKNTSLESLMLDCTKITRGACRVISKLLDNLVVLSLINCDVDDKHVKYFLMNQPKIHKLCLSYNRLLTKKTIRGIVNHERIREVEYRQLELKDEDAVIFFQSDRIRELWIQGADVTNECLKELKKNTTLELIKFVGTNHRITKLGICYLKKLKHIKYIVSGGDDREEVWVRGR